MAINILDAKRHHSMGDKYGGPTLEELKKDKLEQILKLKPILARGIADHLIEFVPDIDPPKLRWKESILNEMQIGQLQMVKNILENAYELQRRTY